MTGGQFRREQLCQRPPFDRHAKLSQAGGGFLGLYTAAVLAALEAEVGEPLGRRFDLIAGTSIGGVLALVLAFEIPMSRLVALFTEFGPAVFSKRALPESAFGRLIDLTRSVGGPKYSGAALRSVSRYRRFKAEQASTVERPSS